MDEVQQLREALAAAEARATALEASKAAAEASKAAAEASKAAAEASKAAAEARATALEESLAASQQKVYFTQLRALAGSASESSSVSADTVRRGAPEAEELSLDAFFDGLPSVAADRVAAAWSEVGLLLAARAPFESTLEGALEEQAERRFVHSLILPLLQALTNSVSHLRLWYEATIADSIPFAEACPDVTWTHARDVCASSLGALVCLELKRWGLSQLPLVRETPTPYKLLHSLTRCLSQAIAQAASYTRRIVGRHVREAHDRGEQLCAIAAVSVACVGSHVVLLRVRSGVPADEDFSAAQPCLTERTPALDLLGGWDPKKPADVALKPPEGFAALLRLLCAPAELLNACAVPLRVVDLDCKPFHGRTVLGRRLGCGGSADVYEVAHPSTGEKLALKLPRCSSSSVATWMHAEAAALLALASSPDGTLPRLLCEGKRVLRSRPSSAQLHALSWPALVLSPAGIPLSSVLAELLASPSRGPQLTFERRKLADAVLRGLLRGLLATHQKELCHCDVRTANTVQAPSGEWLLIDFGLCRGKGEDCARRGVRAFAADCVWRDGACAARAGLDLIAAGHTWLAIMLGNAAGAPPWQARGESAAAWLERAYNGVDADAQLRSLVLNLRTLTTVRDTPAPDWYYSWPWPFLEQRITRQSAAAASSE